LLPFIVFFNDVFLVINFTYLNAARIPFCDANLIKSRYCFAIVEEYPSSTNLAEAASSRYCAFKYSTKVSTLVLCFHVQLVSHQTYPKTNHGLGESSFR
jgi:hypothetical protein